MKNDDKEIEDFMSNLRKEKNSRTVNITREMAKLSVDAGSKDDQEQIKKDDEPKKENKPNKKKKTKRPVRI